MGPTLPAVDRYAHRREAQRNATQMFKEFSHRIQEKEAIRKENEHFRKQGIELEGLRGPAREMKQKEFFKNEARKNAVNATREPGYEGVEKRGFDSGSNAKGAEQYNKEKLPGFMGREEVEPKKGLYSQKTMQGELQPVRSAEQVQEDGIRRARAISANGYTVSDQEGIDYENQKNNETLQSNQRIQEEQQRLQGEKSAMNEKGQTVALNTIGPENLTPEVMAHFGKRAENIAETVDTVSALDKKLAEEIRDYKNMIAVAESAIPAFAARFGSDQSRVTPQAKTDLKLKLDPLLKLGFYDKARDILSKKGYGLEEIEDIISNLSENANRALGQMPDITIPKKVATGGGLAVLAKTEQDMKKQYSENQKELIFSTVNDIFEKDPNTNLVLLRQAMRKKGVDWRMYKDALDKAMYTGKLSMTAEQRTQFDKMNEPELGPLDKMLNFFGIGGK